MKSFGWRWQQRAVTLGVSLLALWLAWSMAPARAQEAAIPTVEIPLETGETAAVPDWANVTFANLPPLDEGGAISIPGSVVSELSYDPSRVWEAGDAVADVLLLGDVGSDEVFGLGQFSVRAIGELLGRDRDFVEQISLADYGLVGRQTVASLVDAIPGLEELPIEEVPLIRDVVAEAGDSVGGRIGDLVDGALGELPIEDILPSLEGYSLGDIPGLAQTPVQSLQDWETVTISDIPGLQDVPFGEFPIALFPGVGAAARADVVFGPAEMGDPLVGPEYYVSGATDGNNTIPVPCNAGETCPYLNLSALFGFERSRYGQRWVSGRAQQVEGGHGPLMVVNDGMEPTGRLVFGKAFKVVLLDAIEPEGRATFGLYFRVCIKRLFVDLGCTPYFIGPVPWLPVKELGLVILAGIDTPQINPPPSFQQEIDATLAERAGPIAGSVRNSDDRQGESARPQHPFPGKAIAFSSGEQCNPVRGRCAANGGVDWVASTLRPVRAAGSGWVRATGAHWLELQHAAGEVSRYEGLERVAVRPGQSVKAGRLLGRAQQLHFEFLRDGERQDPIALLEE